MKSRSIHWFRRDLRVDDNTSLQAAASAADEVVPVYVASSWTGSHHWTGANRQSFLCGCLESLERDLRNFGGRLVVRRGDAVEELARLAGESNASSIHFNADPDPFGRAVEARLAAHCAQNGIACVSHHDLSLHSPTEVLTKDGGPYRVFTPYFRNWLSLGKAMPRGMPGRINTPAELESLALPVLAMWGLKNASANLPTPGESAARDRLNLVIGKIICRYALKRDFPADNGTSRLSQDLRFGLLSPRTVFAAVSEAKSNATAEQRKSIDTFIKELAWREFYFAILHHFPNVLHDEFNPLWRGLPWDGPGELFERWKSGTTGFPIVDAGMRELVATGFMHNRVRMITAMFLTKDLHIDWKLGESWFMQNLIDGEIASNNGGWQWSAGTGADAAPYFRIQNPWTQTARYDREGKHIKRWIPELADVAPEKFLQPPRANQPLAAGYPLPCIDHATERKRTLAMFKRHRGA